MRGVRLVTGETGVRGVTGVTYSFLNSYYHKLSENVWVWGSGASRTRSGGGEDVTIAGQTDEQKGEIELLSH